MLLSSFVSSDPGAADYIVQQAEKKVKKSDEQTIYEIVQKDAKVGVPVSASLPFKFPITTGKYWTARPAKTIAIFKL